MSDKRYEPDCGCWKKFGKFTYSNEINAPFTAFWQDWWAFCPCEGCGKPAKEVG